MKSTKAYCRRKIVLFYLYVDVKEAAFCHFEHEAHFGAGDDLVKEAFFSMSINIDKVSPCRSKEKQ